MPNRPVLQIGPSWWILSLPLLGFFTIPLVALLIYSEPAEFVSNLSNPSVYRAIWISLKTSLWSLGLAMVLGTPLALILARRDFPLKKAVETLVDLPMVLPPAVAGVALLIAFGRSGLLGQYLTPFGVQIPFTQIAVVMAQTFVAAPLFVRSAAIGISRIDNDLEEAAILDGASTRQVLRYVTLPLARPAFLGGAVLTWARALGEFGATIIFAGNLPGRTQTMPLAIYLGFELDMNAAIPLAVILMGVSFLVLVLLRYTLTV